MSFDMDFDQDRNPSWGGLRGRSKSDPMDLPERPAPRQFTDLAAVDLDKELTDQIAEATSFRDYVLTNSTAFNANEVTNTLKTVNALLTQAIKMRETVQNIKRMKAFEDSVTEVMKEQPEDVKVLFFATLRANLALAERS